MFHEDGIKVFVRAYKSKRKDGGYKEFDLPLTDDHDGRRKRCSIEYRQSPVEVTFELSPEFNLHGASALHIGFYPHNTIMQQILPLSESQTMRYHVYHANIAVKGAHKLSSFATHLPDARLKDEAMNEILLTDHEYCLEADLRCMVISIQLGHPQWIDENDAMKNGAVPRSNVRSGTFKRLPGPEGKRYIFEIFTHTKGTKLTRPVRSKRLKTPRICNCPDPEKCSVSGNPRGPREESNNSGKSPASSKISKPRGPKQSMTASSQATASPGEPSLSQEMVATVCRNCKNLKRAPRGKKITWRKRYNTWMVVDARAEDEEPPEEEDGDEGEDEAADAEPDDDGYESQEQNEPDEAPRSQQGGKSHRSDIDVEEDPVRHSPSTPFRLGHRPPTPKLDDNRPHTSIEESSRDPEQHTDWSQSNVGLDGRQLVANGRGPSATPDDGTIATGENGRSTSSAEPSDQEGQRETYTQTSTLKVPSQQQADRINDPRGGVLQAPGHASSAQQVSEIANHSARSQAAPQSHTTSAKRPAPDAIQAITDPAKKPRLVVDFTSENDNGPVVKKEEEEGKDGKIRPSSLILDFADKDENTLREELEDVQLQESKLQLKERRILIQRQLARKLREQGTQNKPIKIEDDG